ATVLLHQPNCTFTDFRGKLVLLAHSGSILSKVGASSKPGAIQVNDHLAAVAELKKALDEARDARRFAFDIMKLTGMEARAAAKAADRAARQLRQVAFEARKGIANTSPLTKYVDDLVNSLRGTDRAPRGILLDKSPTSGRLKERQFQFTFEEYNRLVEDGFLAGNADDAFQGYMKDLGGQLAAHRALGGRGIDDILREVQDDYDALIGSTTDPMTCPLQTGPAGV
ncbi:hypothetical protein QZM92_28570, partial [Burkholderia multivorans]|nr:hypothetical protein [Burkholderia multivorans]